MPSTDQTWSLLKDHAKHIQSSFNVYSQFATTPSRFHNHSLVLEDSASGNSLLFDYSRNLFDDRTLSLLFQLAAQSNVKEWQQKMYAGDVVNVTEGRAAWHVALRDFNFLTGENGREVTGVVADELERMRGVCELVRGKRWIGSTGKVVRNVVNIGIGGSDLGPAAAYEALRDWTDRDEGCKFYFVSNVDDVQLGDVLRECDAEETLFIVVSKTFTTQETMHNAKLAKDWVLNSVCKKGSKLIEKSSAVERHFIAVTSNTRAAAEFGISTKNVLQMWDWVGGRYSVWSAVGISLCIAIGYDNYEQFLKGAEFMDKHFASAPLEKNIPVVMAMLGIWYNNFMDAQSLAVVPYEQRLCRIPAYLQQLEMESNGKSVDKNGKRLSYSTAPIIWGEPGTNGQHAFFQLLHQGTKLIPVDFFIGAQSPSSSLSDSVSESHIMLMANCIAQGEALMKGKPVEVKNGCSNSQENSSSLEMHRFFTGNRPSTTFAYKQLNPFTLGMILAAYEHKVFVQGIVWNVNSFDQFGVELGKSLANTIMRDFTGKVSEHDSSTLGLIQTLQKWGTENVKK